MDIVIYLMWSRFSEKVKTVPSEYRNSFIKDLTNTELLVCLKKGGGRKLTLITVKENTKMQRESIQECSQMASLWGCANKEAKLQQLALGKSQVVIAPAQVITRKVGCESHCLTWAESYHKQFLLGVQELPMQEACPGQERRR